MSTNIAITGAPAALRNKKLTSIYADDVIIFDKHIPDAFGIKYVELNISVIEIPPSLYLRFLPVRPLVTAEIPLSSIVEIDTADTTDTIFACKLTMEEGWKLQLDEPCPRGHPAEKLIKEMQGCEFLEITSEHGDPDFFLKTLEHYERYIKKEDWREETNTDRWQRLRVEMEMVRRQYCHSVPKYIRES